MVNDALTAGKLLNIFAIVMKVLICMLRRIPNMRKIMPEHQLANSIFTLLQGLNLL